jgi:nucleotide-binding universal stress UspA family protein
MSTRHLIVVGVDGSDGGRRALDWAIREADVLDSAVQAVTAWLWQGPETSLGAAAGRREAKEKATRRIDGDIRALVARNGSHVPITSEVVEGDPVEVLAAAGRAGDLLVLGSHGHGRMRQAVLGSVSAACIRKAACPVVVVPAPAPRRSGAPEPAAQR